MTRPTPRRLPRFVCRHLRLAAYLAQPGDGRTRPRIPAATLRWAHRIGQVLREWAFHAIEALVRSPARRALGVGHRFGDDTLAYFTAHCDPAPTRQALVPGVRRATRNKAFEHSRFIGLALDGTGAGRCATARCPLCRPIRDAAQQITGADHRLVFLTVVGTGLTLPVDVEPYGPGDSEYVAGRRLLRRAVPALGVRVADSGVVEGEFATAPFLHTVGDLGLRVIARLKGNRPDLAHAVEARFAHRPPTATFRVGPDRVEGWEADDFDPWVTLRWATVRVLRYRQHQPDGTGVAADWLTDFPTRQVSARRLSRLAKSRWEVENQGFNDGKTRYGLAHIRHHHAASLVLCWLVVALGMPIERLYRLRYLPRGTHSPYPAIALVRLFRLSLGAPLPADSS